VSRLSPSMQGQPGPMTPGQNMQSQYAEFLRQQQGGQGLQAQPAVMPEQMQQIMPAYAQPAPSWLQNQQMAQSGQGAAGLGQLSQYAQLVRG
jgi:hypothetical protein